MNSTLSPGSENKSKANPLFITAAIAVILFCVVGIGVMTGLIPTVGSTSGDAKRVPTNSSKATTHSEVAAKTPRIAEACQNCGVVLSVRVVETTKEGSGLGAIAGGIVGAVVGHQVGGGQGKQLATVAGAVGGAVAGNKVEQNMQKSHRVNVSVRMEDGTTRTIETSTDLGLQSGDKVKIVNGALQRR